MRILTAAALIVILPSGTSDTVGDSTLIPVLVKTS